MHLTYIRDSSAQDFKKMTQKVMQVLFVSNLKISAIVNLPDNWPEENAEMVSFRYSHPESADQTEEFYMKMLPMDHSLEINCMSSLRNDEIINLELK